MSQNRWSMNPSRARLFHFPPLAAQAASHGEEESQYGSFQQAMDQGYQEGLEQGRQSGYQEGLEQGRQAGEKAGFAQGEHNGLAAARQSMDAQLNQLLTPMTALQELLREGHEQQLNSQQELILELVKRVAEQVVRCELTLHPQQILSLIEETLDALPDGREDPTIVLEPSVVATLNELAADKVANWKLQSDATLAVGDVKVITEQCEADASTQSRLDACMEQVGKHLVDDHGAGA
ncbi:MULTISPECIES: flagellar assembly protein FliH [Ferrimonas]|uniref:flagellar assembly protein FliH n=1 Tax=Ferrimonas TaxID=44011 RepID=UPI000422A204|nr:MULTISPECIES: flagellar assembly protein FliH [Ferrimonas]USD36270.1 flagellar assembly protein H [Ferrimonas sp. SCSIO 43195]